MHRILHYLYILLAFAAINCTTAPKVAGQFTEVEFNAMADKMAKGSVKDISVEELKEREKYFVVLDTREKEEYDVSHIKDAIWVGYNDFSLDRLKDIPKGALIVTYCSVGYRSERIGEKLQAAGYINVRNLHGSIFKWINEGYPLFDEDGEATQEVHGYNKEWGKWVKNGKITYCEEPQ